MKQIEILEVQCKLPKHGWHVWNNTLISHFAAGEGKCRHCDVYYNKDFQSNICPTCHKKLSYKPRT